MALTPIQLRNQAFMEKYTEMNYEGRGTNTQVHSKNLSEIGTYRANGFAYVPMDASYGVLNSSKQSKNQTSFSDTLIEKVEEKRELTIPAKESFCPNSSKEVMEAWDKTLEETGIDPFPMNKISTALVIYVENGRQGLSSTFLGDSIASAKSIVEQIIERLENPLHPSDVTEFSKNEMIFYKRFLENLRLVE